MKPTETLDKSDLQRISEALSFFIADNFTTSANEKSPEIQQKYWELFVKVIRIKNSQ